MVSFASSVLLLTLSLLPSGRVFVDLRLVLHACVGENVVIPPSPSPFFSLSCAHTNIQARAQTHAYTLVHARTSSTHLQEEADSSTSAPRTPPFARRWRGRSSQGHAAGITNKAPATRGTSPTPTPPPLAYKKGTGGTLPRRPREADLTAMVAEGQEEEEGEFGAASGVGSAQTPWVGAMSSGVGPGA